MLFASVSLPGSGCTVDSLRMSRVSIKYRLVSGAGFLHLRPSYVMEASLKTQGYPANESTFIEYYYCVI
jgi:hypothetical protein